jgi:hypothetical protein
MRSMHMGDGRKTKTVSRAEGLDWQETSLRAVHVPDVIGACVMVTTFVQTERWREEHTISHPAGSYWWVLFGRLGIG